ncbi:acetylornithine deacetylase [Telmatospirillum siberiense]|uniref:Acetylornithine deacetylase n=1 Tax=Telmatospirillum siberiense TaxID=382514 RepID=A0A2N3PTZ1_9PROT|nr:acetylornithine deacetylase [Telmatospirillum siberiense]PKU23863.1 acetylornithine deacetylase [Telmatospirillum siberiense]
MHRDSIAILRDLIAFPTVSRDGNLDLIAYAEKVLADCGAKILRVQSEDGCKANLHAVIGPEDRPGVMLSGHTDVVPVDGQTWSHDPFTLRAGDGRLFGRGTADMKGFIACVLALAGKTRDKSLKVPLVVALSYDEEVGCLGVRRLLDMMESMPVRPRFCIVGEPTSLQVISAHKGKTAARIECRGVEAHSSLPGNGLNAIHLACDMVGGLRRLQADILRDGHRDDGYEVPHTTVHVGRIQGGTALNIVPNLCWLDFEIRHLPQDDIDGLMAAVRTIAGQIRDDARKNFPQADVLLKPLSSYPPLDTPADAEVVAFVKSLTGGNSTGKISFGTEGGLYTRRLGVPTVVCGPGSIVQAHKPDEYIDESQLAACDAMMDRLLSRLTG